jgi:hypothetical protein
MMSRLKTIRDGRLKTAEAAQSEARRALDVSREASTKTDLIRHLTGVLLEALQSDPDPESLTRTENADEAFAEYRVSRASIYAWQMTLRAERDIETAMRKARLADAQAVQRRKSLESISHFQTLRRSERMAINAAREEAAMDEIIPVAAPARTAWS